MHTRRYFLPTLFVSCERRQNKRTDTCSASGTVQSDCCTAVSKKEMTTTTTSYLAVCQSGSIESGRHHATGHHGPNSHSPPGTGLQSLSISIPFHRHHIKQAHPSPKQPTNTANLNFLLRQAGLAKQQHVLVAFTTPTTGDRHAGPHCRVTICDEA